MNIFRLSILIFFCLGCTNAGKQVSTAKQQTNGKIYSVWATEWSPSGTWIAAGGTDGIVRILLSKDLEELKSYNLKTWLHAISWHPVENIIAVATLNQYVKIVNLNNNQVIDIPDTGGARAIGWSPDGQILAVADQNGILKFWTKNDLKFSESAKSHTDAAQDNKSFLGMDWHPSGKKLSTVVDDIKVFNLQGIIESRWEHRNKAAVLLCVKWHPTGKFLVVGDYGHNWSGENVPSLLHFWSENGEYIRAVSGSKGEFRNVDWNTAGTKLASSSDVLRIWSNEGTLINQSEPDSLNYLWGLSWSPSGTRIVTGSRNGEVAIWDENARLLKKIQVINSPLD